MASDSGRWPIGDTYNRRARLYAFLTLALPLGITTVAFFPDAVVGWGALWALIVCCGGIALMVRLARDCGKHKEPQLFDMWGGKPTTRLLRHRDAANPVILQRRHQRLQQLLPDRKIPTAQDEKQDPKAADDVYEACATFLREATRDKQRFPLVFEELCNYGFRRNIWGLRPFGIATSAIGTSLVGLLVIADAVWLDRYTGPIQPICGILNAALFVFWLAWVKPDWVKLAADEYAERLLGSCDAL